MSIIKTLLSEYEYLFQYDYTLYHYVTPISYSGFNALDEFGYRDIIGLDIKIL